MIGSEATGLIAVIWATEPVFMLTEEVPMYIARVL